MVWMNGLLNRRLRKIGDKRYVGIYNVGADGVDYSKLRFVVENRRHI